MRIERFRILHDVLEVRIDETCSHRLKLSVIMGAYSAARVLGRWGACMNRPRGMCKHINDCPNQVILVLGSPN